jgi:RNA polymerase sigma-70 factor (ECF subfamily)
MAELSETELIERCRRGDADAWDEVFDRHYAAVGRFVFQVGAELSHEDMEEICQETFLSAIRNLGSFQGGSQLQTWLFRIAANKAHDFRQRQRAAKRGGGQHALPLHADDPENPFAVDPPSAAPGPDLALLHAENAVLISRALDRLGGPCQEIIELRYFADLSYDEIARTLQLNVKTVSSRLSKCLDKLEGIARAIFSGEKSRTTSV